MRRSAPEGVVRTPVSFERTGWPGQPHLWVMRRLCEARRRVWIGTRPARPHETIGGPSRAEPPTGDWQGRLRVPVVFKVCRTRRTDGDVRRYQRGVLPGQDISNSASGVREGLCLDAGFLQVTPVVPLCFLLLCIFWSDPNMHDEAGTCVVHIGAGHWGKLARMHDARPGLNSVDRLSGQGVLYRLREFFDVAGIP